MALKLSGGVQKATYVVRTLLDGVTATTTSAAVPSAGANRATFALTRADHSAGSSAFKIQGTVDGTTWVDLNSLMEDLTNTNAQNHTRVTTITLAADGTTFASLDLEHATYLGLRVVVTETTDGTHTAKVLLEY